ncbi:CHAT domain-containing protein [Microcoleus sp.]|uniref:CHAT domain-containing protein n=1 Tax=Microcoleus sp. TaxID=44472 RepID=UPI0035240AD1
MDKQRQEAYINLIQLLLSSSQTEREAVLKANRELITLDLIPLIQQMTIQKKHNGEQESAIFLEGFAGAISNAFAKASTRINLYRELIEKLLNSPEGEETEILNASSNLIDEGLVEALEEFAEVYAQNGNKNAIFLRYMATKVSALLDNSDIIATPENYASFLAKSLTLIQDNDCNSDVVYPFFLKYQHLLNQEFAQRIHNCTGASNPEGIATALMNFSNLVAAFPLGNRSINLEIGIAGYETALQMISSENFPKLWGKLQINLGYIYIQRLHGKKIDNLEISISSLEKALLVYQYQAFSVEYIIAQNTLAAAYSERISGKRAENIEKAISYLITTLNVCNRETHPEQWAMTQTNLASAYIKRIYGDPSENIERAIICLTDSCLIYTCDAFPKEWADVNNNLAGAWKNRINGLRYKNLERAISCLENALEVYTFEKIPEKWLMIQNNLATIYSDYSKYKRADNLEQSMNCYNNALQLCSHDAFSQDWAMLQNNLAGLYLQIGDIEKAITCFLNALQIRTREFFPEEWATTQHNLGSAYFERIIANQAGNFEQVMICFQKALQVRTRASFPIRHTETLFIMGLTYKVKTEFYNAHNTFFYAIDTVESLRGEIISDDTVKQKLAEQWNTLYQYMVEVCLELEYFDQAIEYVERSKTRNLVELILTRDRHTIFPAEVVAQLDRLRDEIASGQYELQNATAEAPTALAHQLQQLRQQRNELQDRYLPLGSGFQFDQFRSTMSDRTAIVEFYITTDKLLVFIITNQTQQPIVLSPDLINPNKLANWANSYLKAYINKNSHWQRRLTTRLHLLAKILHVDEILQQIPTECDKLILIPHRYLHLVPLHALPINSQAGTSQPQILMDRFPKGVRYAPSCQLLQLAKTRKRPNFTHLFAIQNPTKDLTYADLEVAAIQSYFDSTSILEKDAATKAALDDTPLNTFHCVHFSCHGYFNSNPSQANKSALILADAELDSSLIEFDSERHLLLTGGKVLELDKCLTLDAIFSLKFQLDRCRLVVLSACETGLIDFRNTSDEYIGLVSGFLFAGSPSVVSSLWEVDQVSTAFLFIKFYENLKSYSKLEEGDVAIALQDAQSWLRNLTSEEGEKLLDKIQLQIESLFPGKPRSARAVKTNALKRIQESGIYPFSDPYYWAAFTATGF